MLFNRPIVANVMKMPIVKVVNVISVLDPRVFTIGSVLMVVVGMQIRHKKFLQGEWGTFNSIACMTPLVTSRDM
jgi:hypothetical protein